MSADQVQIAEEPMEGLLLLRSPVIHDHRGSFWETWHQQRFAQFPGLSVGFVQSNQSFSRHNVLRGLHYQLERPQGKLVRVTAGEVFDVAVDLRRGSNSFARWYGVSLRGDDGLQLWIPPGFAHGFLVTSPDGAYVDYALTAHYDPMSERTLVWNDRQVAIEWPLQDAPILSDKDRQGVALTDSDVFA
jgi:dTDP-4-dehydrorhamnose 3,5-epimerase